MTVVDPAPERLVDVVSPEWLNAALDGVTEGGSFVDARIVDDYTTVASKVRFEAVVEGRDGRRTTHSYCVKAGFGETHLLNLAIEGRFYRELAPSLGMRVPTCVYAGVDERTGRSLFIMNDLVTEGVTFLNAQSPYTPELTRATLEQLARLHAKTWGEERLRPLDWLATNRPAVAEAMPVELLEDRVNDGRAASLPDYLRDARRIQAAMRRICEPRRICVVHGDAHSLNIYLDREGRPGLFDWQMAHIGHWATDVSYHIGAVLDIETRRRHEESLLRGYLEDLAKFGREPPSWEEAWNDYTLHFAYGYFLWCVAQITPRPDILEHIPRLGTAIDDHDTFTRLGI